MTTHNHQGYTFGWIVAASNLITTTDPALINDWGNVFGFWGSIVATTINGWSLVVGISAAAVRPWSWYVVILSPVLFAIFTGFYVTAIAPNWNARIFAGVLFPIGSAICFVYFYKRRALFGAQSRWSWLERSCPKLVGPDTLSTERVPGFRGLSSVRQGLFIAVVAIAILMRLFHS